MVRRLPGLRPRFCPALEAEYVDFSSAEFAERPVGEPVTVQTQLAGCPRIQSFDQLLGAEDGTF